MTEKKRFTIMGRVCYYDSLIFDNDTNTEMGTSKVVDLLNEQNHAIKWLQEDNKRLKEYINRIEYSYQREYGMSLRNAEWLE